jgi:hypothetical protein
MEKFARVVVLLIGLAMLGGAVGFGFLPHLMERDFAVVASRIDGLGTLRADLGGSFLSLAIITLLSLRRGQSHWLQIPTLFMGAFLLYRSVHFVMDGISRAGMRSFIVEVILIAVLLWARRVLAKSALL